MRTVPDPGWNGRKILGAALGGGILLVLLLAAGLEIGIGRLFAPRIEAVPDPGPAKDWTPLPWKPTKRKAEPPAALRRAVMNGRNGAGELEVPSINIWDGVPRGRVVCQLRDGQGVDVLGSKYYSPESRSYYRVRADSCEGWVPEPFIRH